MRKEFEGETRKEKLKQVKKGPGLFVYDGSAVDTEYVPTLLVTKGKEPVIGENGLPVLDKAGRQVFKPVGTPVLDSKGNVQLGGEPKVKRHPIEVHEIWGEKFPKGKPVEVTDPKLARKLRCMAAFEEVDPEELKKKAPKKKAPKKSA